MSPVAVLRAASRELGAVRAASQSEGWNGELAGRAAAALRLAGAVALSRPVSQKEVDRDTPPSEGQVAALAGLGSLRGKTHDAVRRRSRPTAPRLNGNSASAQDMRVEWRSLSQALGAVHGRRGTAANGGVDGTALDAALAEARTPSSGCASRSGGASADARRHAETAAARQTWAR